MKTKGIIITMLFTLMVVATVAQAQSYDDDNAYLNFRNDDYFDFRDSDDDLGDQDYRSRRMKKINVCSPARSMVVELKKEIQEKSDGQVEGRMRNLRMKISNKRNKIDGLIAKRSSVKEKRQKLKTRLKELTTNMPSVVSIYNKQIAQGDSEIKAKNERIAHFQHRKSRCKGGFLGSFCRSKYRGKIKDAKRHIEQVNRRKANLVAAKRNLPNEKRQLPAKIKQASNQIQGLQQSLTTTKTAKPTIEQMQNRLNKMIAINEDIASAVEQLVDELRSAKMMFAKCRRMRRLAKAYPIMKRKAETFINKPVLCDEVDSFIDMTDKTYQKMAISDAANIACQF